MSKSLDKARHVVHRYRHWWSDRKLKRLLRSLLPESQINLAIRGNRNSLKEIDRWIDDATYDGSIFQYGLPIELKGLIDLPTGPEATHADVLQVFANRLTKPINYLEIGVSVGKTFWQMLNGLPSNSRLTGFDIEEINPKLADQLHYISEKTWAGPTNSLRKFPGRDMTFKFTPRGQSVRYLAADIYDGHAWIRLAGQRFNLIFSDALHSVDAIEQELDRLFEHGLIDADEFVIIWDDLHGNMRVAWETMSRKLCEKYNLPNRSAFVLPMRGWLGTNYDHHPVGIVFHLPNSNSGP